MPYEPCQQVLVTPHSRLGRRRCQPRRWLAGSCAKESADVSGGIQTVGTSSRQVSADTGKGSCRRDRTFPNVQRHIVAEDRKSTRLNSSHVEISYAVFCL